MPDWARKIAEDDELLRDLQACRAWCVPLSEFRRWDPNDRAAALGLLEYERSLCPGCRDDLAETTKPENEDKYVADLPIRCHRCTASERASEAYRESPQPGALLTSVRKIA